MSSITTYCPTCGNAFDPGLNQDCPYCSAPVYTAAPDSVRKWGAGTGLLVWLASVVLIFGFQIIAVIIYLFVKLSQTGKLPQVIEIDWLIAVLSIASTFPAHFLTLLICWLVVTSRGQR